MLIRRLQDCPEIVAGDETILRELLNPVRADLGVRPAQARGPAPTPFAPLPFCYSLAHAVVQVGKASQPHRMRTSEVYYILEGEGEMHIDNESAMVQAGCAISIPPGSRQFIRNTGTTDLKFLCIVDPAWRPDDEQIG